MQENVSHRILGIKKKKKIKIINKLNKWISVYKCLLLGKETPESSQRKE
jgi:hypothetical protein